MTTIRTDRCTETDTTEALALARPENRRRRLDVALWSDTLPCCFRSEGFAEDLQRNGTVNTLAPRRLAQRRRPASSAPAHAVAAVLALTRALWARRAV